MQQKALIAFQTPIDNALALYVNHDSWVMLLRTMSGLRVHVNGG